MSSYGEPQYGGGGPVSYFENYDRYRYEDPRFPGAPLKEDWWWDLQKPPSDSTALGMYRAMFPNAGENNPDVINAADPLLQDIFSEIVADRDLAEARTFLNTPEFQERLRGQIGKGYWNELRKRGQLTDENLPGEQLDEEAIKGFVNPGLENLLSQYYPSTERAMGELQFGLESAGGRPIPMGELPGYEGPGFAGPDAMGAEGAGGQGAPAGGGAQMPSDMQQRLENVIAQQPALEMMPKNAYHTALQQRLGREGYHGTGALPSTRGFWKNAVRDRGRQEESNRQSYRDARSRRGIHHKIGDFLDDAPGVGWMRKMGRSIPRPF